MLNTLVIGTLAVSTVLQVQIEEQGPAGRNGAAALSFSGRSGQLEVSAPRFDAADVHIDGRLEEDVWTRATVLHEFSQYEPVEGIPSSERTEVLVFYTSDAMYFGVRAFDRQPDQILARLGERDRAIFGDDWIRIMVDTFNDRRQAYVFYVNPLGIQTDGLWIEGMERRMGMPVSIDFNVDFIWESDGRLTDDGWTAEIKIPYVSLRFREVPVQDWGINVMREIRRLGYKQAWAPLTENISSTLAQSGRLVGLQNIQPRRLVEVNPVATGKRVGAIQDDLFAREDPEGEFGMNARMGLTRNLVLDATFNPDFSQVEADDNRLTVNERFALFFPEKRPFFLEGAEIFRTPTNLVHTRQIADPDAGAKLSGKVGDFNVGYLGAFDRSPTSLFDGAFGDSSAVFNLVRVRRDVGRGSTVGLLYTDRTMTAGGGYNRVLAADARFLFGGKYTLTGQFAGSWTSDGLAGGARMRPLAMAKLEKSGRTFEWAFEFDDINPGFSTRSGFVPRVGDTKLDGRATKTFFGRPGAILERIRVNLNANGFWDHDEFWNVGTPYEYEIQNFTTFSFRGGRSLTFILRDGYFRFRPEDYQGYEVQGVNGVQPFEVPKSLTHLLALGVMPRMRITNEVQLNGRFFLRATPIFTEAERGWEIQGGPEVTVRPTNALQVSLNHTYSRITRDRDGSVFSTVNISRLRTQYQFNKALFVRAIVQYDLEQRDALRDPVTGQPLVIDGAPVPARDDGEFQSQFLAQYQPSPGTIFFIGYSRLMEGERTYRFTRMNPTADGLFVKLSYLFRM